MNSALSPAWCLALATATVVIPASSMFAAGSASDNASNSAYSDGWQNNDNSGTGFSSWNLSTNNAGGGNTPFAGFLITNSTGVTGDPGSGNINTSGLSFGIYANPNGAFATATRTFSGGTLAIGETFSVQIAVNFRNGSKGFNLRSGGSDLFGFNVSSDNYFAGPTGNTASLGLLYQPDSIFTLSFTQTSTTTELVTITRTSAGGGTEVALNQTFTLSGVDGFQFYNSNTGDGANANNLYFNNLLVAVPEPSTWALCAVASVAALRFLRRRRA